VLRALCELDVSSVLNPRIITFLSQLFHQCGIPLLLDRIKQSMVSCRVRLRWHATRRPFEHPPFVL
jgi:hypothetical protein